MNDMNKNKEILDLLVRSFDGSLTSEEREALEAALAASEGLREERARLVKLREAVSSARRDAFSPFFAERVMQRIRAEQRDRGSTEAFSGALSQAFRSVAIVGAAVAIGLVIYNFAKTNDISLTGAVGVSVVTSEEMMKPPVDAILEAT